MPEGPEVKRLVTQLHSVVQGKELVSVNPISGRYFKNNTLIFNDVVLLRLVKGVYCKGKFIWWELGNNFYIFCTLGMTGGFLLEPTKYSRVVFKLSDLNVYFHDQRNFGTLKFICSKEELRKKLASLGPDMLSDPCFFEDFVKITKFKRCFNKSLVVFLMEQKNISGVGNIYKSEILYRAKLDPSRIVSSLTEKELLRLYTSIKEVLCNAYVLGGSTIKNYVDLYGKEGEFVTREDKQSLNHAQNENYSLLRVAVYNQKIDPLGNPVIKLSLDDKRTTYFVPEIQK